MKKSSSITIIAIFVLSIVTTAVVSHDIGFEAGIIAMDIGLGYQDVEPHQIIIANMVALNEKVWATKKAIFKSEQIETILDSSHEIRVYGNQFEENDEPGISNPIGWLLWLFSPSNVYACDHPSGCTEAPTIINNPSANLESNATATAAAGSQSISSVGSIDVSNEHKSFNEQSIRIDDKRDYLQGPGIVTPDTDFADVKGSIVRLKGSMWDRFRSMTYQQALNLSKGSDVEIEAAVIDENPFKTDRIWISKPYGKADLLAVLHVYSNSSAPVTEGVVMLKAMELGATHIVVVERSYREEAIGTSKSIGAGGGASIINSADKIAIAPTGGTGYSKATASNVAYPEMVVECWFDPLSIRRDKNGKFLYREYKFNPNSNGH